MKVTFPYFGCVTGLKKMMELLGHEVIMPSAPTQHTIDLGVENSPEFLCYPFKVMLGTYLDACERGADLIISSGGHGPCRAGLYGEIHRVIIEQKKYNAEVLIFDAPYKDFKDFVRKVKLVLNKTPLWKAMKAALLCWNMICQMDALEKRMKIERAYEIKRGDFDKAWQKIKTMYDKCYNFRDLKAAKKESTALFDAIPLKKVAEKDRVRIGIVGEIYVIMEPGVNMHIEEKLNSMGVEVENVQYISNWVKHNTIPKWMNTSKSWKVIKKAKRYTDLNCGGHDMENMGWMVQFAEEGFSGIIHLIPFGCLPEMVSRSIIPTISDDLNIPIISISLDEQTGEANNQTRIEAFIDLCRNKQAARYEMAEEPVCEPERQNSSLNKKEAEITI